MQEGKKDYAFERLMEVVNKEPEEKVKVPTSMVGTITTVEGDVFIFGGPGTPADQLSSAGRLANSIKIVKGNLYVFASCPSDAVAVILARNTDQGKAKK